MFRNVIPNDFVKSAGIPSEPGVFSGSILFKACRHSDLVSKPSQLSFSSAFKIFVSSKKLKFEGSDCCSLTRDLYRSL